MKSNPTYNRRHVDPAQRGSTLVISLLMVMFVGAIGLFAVRSSRSELSTSGSHRFAKTAHYVAESVGYGLDYAEHDRTLPYIGAVQPTDK